MSVRAYRVLKIETAGESFNLWHDIEVTRWLEKNTGFFESMVDGTGVMDVSIEDLEEMLKEIGDKIPEHVKKNIRDDIEFAKKQGDDYVTYYCY